jgi:hypothetical protein
MGDIDMYDWNLNIADQIAKPADFSENFIAAAWQSRELEDCYVDPAVYLYGH